MVFKAEDKQRVIILAGAGASVHLGLPTLDDLLQRAVLGNDEIAELIRDTRNSIEAVASRYKKAVFEELIVQIREYLRITHKLRTDPTLRKGLGGLPYDVDNGSSEFKWKKALTRCYRVLIDEYGPSKIDYSRPEFDATLELFLKLSELNQGSLHIFTTNYDCSYQVLASKSKDLRFMTHINNTNGRFSDQWFPVQKKLENKQIPNIYIHRLHGCVAWFMVFSDGDDLGTNCGTVEEPYGAGGRLTIDDDDYLSNMCIKLIAAQLVGTNPVFATAFDEFTRHLKTADNLLVWGYSFRDLEVMRQINNAVAAKDTLVNVSYLDPYLPKEKVINNIRRTFHAIPIPVSSQFLPQRIDWLPTYGFDKLVSTVFNHLTEVN